MKVVDKLTQVVDESMLIGSSVCVCACVCVCHGAVQLVKGELNVDKKWQSDDLFNITMNEICPRVDQF